MKKFKLLVGAVALFALVAVNVWNAATTLKASALSIEDVEAMAQIEEGGYYNDPDTYRGAWIEQYAYYDSNKFLYIHYEECKAYGCICECNLGNTLTWMVYVGNLE